MRATLESESLKVRSNNNIMSASDERAIFAGGCIWGT